MSHLFRLTRLDCPATAVLVPSVLFWPQPCLSYLSCSSCPVLAGMFWLSCPLCPGQAVLSLLHVLSFVQRFFSWLSCARTLVLSSSVPAVLPMLLCSDCSGCPVLAVLSRLSFTGCHAFAVFWLSWGFYSGGQSYSYSVTKFHN
jgi:hypothetical protein